MNCSEQIAPQISTGDRRGEYQLTGETLYSYDSSGLEGTNVNDVSTGHFPGRKQLRRLTQIFDLPDNF